MSSVIPVRYVDSAVIDVAEKPKRFLSQYLRALQLPYKRKAQCDILIIGISTCAFHFKTLDITTPNNYRMEHNLNVGIIQVVSSA